MASKHTEKLTRLEEQRARLEHKINMLKAREQTITRKQETRRKILIGSYFLDKANKENTMTELAKQLDTFLTRDSDRVLFNLPPLKTTENAQKK